MFVCLYLTNFIRYWRLTCGWWGSVALVWSFHFVNPRTYSVVVFPSRTTCTVFSKLASRLHNRESSSWTVLARIEDRGSSPASSQSSRVSRLDPRFSILARIEKRVSTYLWAVLYYSKRQTQGCTKCFSFFHSSFPLYLFIYFSFYTFVCTRFFFFKFSLKYSVYLACTYFLCKIILYPDSVCYL